MCLCRRSSGSDTWPDLLHSTRTSREQRPVRTLTHSSRPTSLQVRLQEVFTQCISQVSQAWIPLWQSCNSKKNCPLLLHMWNELITAPCGCSGRIHRRQKSDYFFERKRWKKMKRSWAGSQPFLGLFFLLLCFIYFIMNALWFSSESQNQRPQNIRRSRHLPMQNY